MWLASLLLLGSLSPASAWEPTFVLPASPVPWFFVMVVGIVALLLGGVVALLARRVLVEHKAQLPAGLKQGLQKGYVDTMRDTHVKKAKALEDQMKALKSRFSLVFVKTRNLTTTLDPEEIFKSIVDMLQQEMGCDRFVLLLHDKVRDELYTFRHIGVDEGAIRGLTIPLSEQCFVTWAFKKRQLVYRGAAEDDHETRGLIDRPPLRNTVIALPIATPDQCFGVIEIEGFADGRTIVSEDDLRFLSTLGTFIGMALGNANVFLTTKEELTSAKAMSQRELEEKKRLKDLFGRYAHPSLVEDLISNPGSVRLGGSTKTATILFSDIAGFTKFSAKLTPEQVVNSINEYLSRMTEIVLNHNGEIDKFIGDAVMARFGVLADLPDAPLWAVKAAVAMFTELAELQRRWLLQGRDGFTIRVGIATGPVLAGNIGSERRQEFTVMGTTVNLASRLEALNKELHSQLLIDANTFQAVAPHVNATKRDDVNIRGLEGAITVYEVHEMLTQQAQQAKIISFKNKIASQTKAAAPPASLTGSGAHRHAAPPTDPHATEPPEGHAGPDSTGDASRRS